MRSYYDLPAVLNMMEEAERTGSLRGLGGLSVRDVSLPEEWTSAIVPWQHEVLTAARRGEPADLSAFPSVVLLDKARGDDQRSKMLTFAEETLSRFDHLPATLNAFQIVLLARDTLFRGHQKIRGAFVSILWRSKRGPRANFLWELIGEERRSASHVTVIRGTVDGAPGSFVFWNLGPSILRSLPDERLAAMLNASLSVPGTRGRLEQARKMGITSADVRSHVFEEMKRGTHPAALGSRTVDALERSAFEGLAGLSGKLVELDPDVADLSQDPTMALERKQAVEELRRELEGLDTRTSAMVSRHSTGESQESIAADYGITQERVGQIIRQAHLALRRRLSP